MNTTHHPDEATLMEYAAGTLDEAFAVTVSCHLEICPDCRKAVRAAEAMGGAMLCEQVGAPVAEGSFGRLLEKISAASGEGGNTAPAVREQVQPQRPGSVLPAALGSYIGRNVDEIRWKRIGPGVWQHPIRLSDGAKSSLRLLRIAPGRSVPEHGHGGQEITLILSGAYRDEIGYFGPGDVADLDEDIEHQPRVVSDEDCICLAATEKPTRFKSVAGRLLQPFVGI